MYRRSEPGLITNDDIHMSEFVSFFNISDYQKKKKYFNKTSVIVEEIKVSLKFLCIYNCISGVPISIIKLNFNSINQLLKIRLIFFKFYFQQKF